jgi:hypothetical protein
MPVTITVWKFAPEETVDPENPWNKIILAHHLAYSVIVTDITCKYVVESRFRIAVKNRTKKVYFNIDICGTSVKDVGDYVDIVYS